MSAASGPRSASGGDAAASAATLLGRTRLFGDLDSSALQRLARVAAMRSVSRGEFLFHQGDPGDSLFVMAAGLVKVLVSSPDGEEMTLVTLSPPDTFGELAVVDGGPRSASAQAAEPTAVLALGRTALLEAVGQDPRIAEALLRSVGALVRRLTDQAADLVFLDLHGRVAKLLCGLCSRQGGGPALDLQLTQAELASMVGGSRQSVNQILRGFEQAGLVEVRGRRMVIRRLDLLRRRAGLPEMSGT